MVKNEIEPPLVNKGKFLELGKVHVATDGAKAQGEEGEVGH